MGGSRLTCPPDEVQTVVDEGNGVLHFRSKVEGFAAAFVIAMALGPALWVVSECTPGMRPNPKARQVVAELQMCIFRDALLKYANVNGVFPTDSQGLDALIARPRTLPKSRSWKGPYFDGTQIPRDPWGNRYVFEAVGASGEGCRIVSYGADGILGGSGQAADLSISLP